jgi:hypothetical protein
MSRCFRGKPDVSVTNKEEYRGADRPRKSIWYTNKTSLSGICCDNEE